MTKKQKNNKIFELKNVNLFYDEFQAIKNITMNINSNEVTAFIGPSGCGKSTFIRILNRMNDLIASCKLKLRNSILFVTS